MCGEDDPRVTMEAHHVFGRANSEETLIICQNCHRKLTYDQNKLAPKKRNRKASKKDRLAFEDVSIGSALELFGKRLKKRGLEKHG